MMKRILLSICLGCFAQHALYAGPTFHVSPTGDDQAAGTAAAPFRTLARARDAVRASGPQNGAEVVLHEGTYFLSDPVEFTGEDSGSAENPVVYRAADGEDVWLNGGISLKLDEFRSVGDPALLNRIDPAAKAHVREFVLPKDVVERLSPEWPDTWWMYRKVTSLTELFAGDRRLPMARWPNEGYTTFGDIVVPAESDGETPTFKYKGERPERWQSAVQDGLWLYGYWRRGYRSEFIKVKSIDPGTKQIELCARNSLGALEDGGAKRYCAMHVLEELDTPGEWYLDRKNNRLILWPPESPKASDVSLSVNQDALVKCREASNLVFRGLGLECSAGRGVSIWKSRNCRVVGCEIRNVGTYGVYMEGDRNQVVGCDIHHTGDKAIVMKSGDRYTLTRGDSLIDNCHLHHTNRIVRAGSQAVSLDGVGNFFSHNLIHDTGYIAIRFAGNDHVLENNRLFRTNVESAEGGIFYTGRDWTSRGSIIRYNFMHHVEDTQEGCGSSTRFVHLDDSAPGIDIYGNVCYRLGGGVSICGGAANNVHDNLFVECAWGVDIGPRGKDMFESDGKGGFIVSPDRKNWGSLTKYLLRYKWNEPPYSTHYPKLIEIFTKTPIAAPWFNIVVRNVMVDCGRGIRIANMEPEWSTIENNWEGDDPGFVEPDHTKLDFGLADSAVVYKEIAFKPLPKKLPGLYASADRRSWPVPLDLPPKDWKPRWMRLREEAQKSPTDLSVFKVMQVTGKIVVDGTVDPMEWTPGDATGRAPEIHDTAELATTHAGGKAKRPSQAMLQTDDNYLYVNFRNEIDPAAGVTAGHRWGKDDAVEIALSEVRDGKIGSIIVLRGFADGYFESSNEAGASPEVVARAAQGVRYAAGTSGKSIWAAEWQIPFSSLGIDPKKENPRLVFNLSVRKPAGDEWVMWNRNGGSTWDVHRSGFLWLAQFGDMASGMKKTYASSGRIDIDSRQHPVMMKPMAGCGVATWAKPVGCYLSVNKSNLATDQWQEMAFSFVPQEDGEVILKFMGAGIRIPGTETFVPVWVYSDKLEIEGAEIVNGDFEAPGKKGIPNGWRSDVRPGLWIHDPKLAVSGEYCIKTCHNSRFAQKISVTKGQTVTVRVMVRGVE